MSRDNRASRIEPGIGRPSGTRALLRSEVPEGRRSPVYRTTTTDPLTGFGIRFGRLWSFYVQRNGTVTTLRLVKKSEVTKTGDKRHLTGTSFNVSKEIQKRSGLFQRNKTVYIAQEEMSIVLGAM